MSQVIIYDADCNICSIGISIIRKSRSVMTIDWNNQEIQDILSDYFEEVPYIMMVVDENRLYTGEKAVERLFETTPEMKKLSLFYEDVAHISTALSGNSDPDLVNVEKRINSDTAKEIRRIADD